MQKTIWISAIVFVLILISFLFNPDYTPWLVILLIIVILFLAKLDQPSGLIFFIFIFPFLTLLPEQLHGYPISLAAILFLCLLFFRLLKQKSIHILQTALDAPLSYFSVLVIVSAIVTILSLSYAPLKLVLLKYIYSIPNLFTTYAEDRFDAAIQGARTLLLGIGFYYFLVLFLRDNNKLRDRIIATILVSSGFISGYGLIQYFSKWNLLEYWKTVSPHLVRINSSFSDPNAYGAYLVLILPLALIKIVENKGKRGWKYAGLSMLLILNLIWTASRSAWFSLILSLLLMLVILSFTKLRNEIPYHYPRTHFRKISIGIIIFVGIVAILLILISTHSTPTDFSQHKSYWDVLQFSLNAKAEADTILKNRIPLWEAAFRMVAYHPWTGIGIGSYPFWLQYFKGEHVITFLKISHAHNYYLEILAELGLLGLGIFLWLLYSIFNCGWKVIRQAGLVPLGLLTGIGAFLLALLTQHALVQMEMQFMLWIPVALLVTYAEPAKPDIKFQIPKTGITIFLLFLFCVYGYSFLALDKQKTLLDYSVGMYKAESNSGYEFRWTNRVAYKPIVIHGRSFTLPILVYHPDIMQKPVEVQIYLNRVLLDTLSLNQPGWTEHTYLVPDSIPTSPNETKNAVLTVVVNRTWNPWQKSGSASFWDYRRLGAGVAFIRWKAPPPLADHLALDIGTPDARPYLAYGWYSDELSGDKKTAFAWSQGSISKLYLPLFPNQDYLLRLRLLPFAYDTAPEQIVTISINDKYLQSNPIINSWTWQEVLVPIPAVSLYSTVNILNLEYKYSVAPKNVLPNNTDSREIAIACDSVIVTSHRVTEPQK
jgi:O-antigen ligase